MNEKETIGIRGPIDAVCFDWGGTLMADDGPADVPMARWPRVAVIPGARGCLATLHGGLPLYVATNAADSSRVLIEEALGRGGLLRFVSGVFCFSELGHRKHEPEFWQVVRECLGIPLGRIVMVGDSLEHDVLAPRRWGVQAVWFNRDGRHPDSSVPVPTVHTHEEFARLVESAR